jgi:hypothetical protein
VIRLKAGREISRIHLETLVKPMSPLSFAQRLIWAALRAPLIARPTPALIDTAVTAPEWRPSELAMLCRADICLSGDHHAFFPFRPGGLMHVSLRSLGGGPRRYPGTGTTCERGFGLIGITPSGDIGEPVHAAPDFNRAMPQT